MNNRTELVALTTAMESCFNKANYINNVRFSKVAFESNSFSTDVVNAGLYPFKLSKASNESFASKAKEIFERIWKVIVNIYNKIIENGKKFFSWLRGNLRNIDVRIDLVSGNVSAIYKANPHFENIVIANEALADEFETQLKTQARTYAKNIAPRRVASIKRQVDFFSSFVETAKQKIKNLPGNTSFWTNLVSDDRQRVLDQYLRMVQENNRLLLSNYSVEHGNSGGFTLLFKGDEQKDRHYMVVYSTEDRDIPPQVVGFGATSHEKVDENAIFDEDPSVIPGYGLMRNGIAVGEIKIKPSFYPLALEYIVEIRSAIDGLCDVREYYDGIDRHIVDYKKDYSDVLAEVEDNPEIAHLMLYFANGADLQLYTKVANTFKTEVDDFLRKLTSTLTFALHILEVSSQRYYSELKNKRIAETS